MAKNKEIFDPVAYEDASKPYASAEEANNALEAFWNAVYELRKKHGIANVAVIAQSSIAGSGSFFWSAHCGNQVEQESMAAWHFGKMSSDRQEMIRRAIEFGAREAVRNGKSERLF